MYIAQGVLLILLPILQVWVFFWFNKTLEDLGVCPCRHSVYQDPKKLESLDLSLKTLFICY